MTFAYLLALSRSKGGLDGTPYSKAARIGNLFGSFLKICQQTCVWPDRRYLISPPFNKEGSLGEAWVKCRKAT